MTLAKRGLVSVPVLEGESQARLLVLASNSIASLDNLGAVPGLIFLDVYNNALTSLDGLEPVPNLRVLMAGKNSVASLDGLGSVPKLDVLDVHANALTTPA